MSITSLLRSRASRKTLRSLVFAPLAVPALVIMAAGPAAAYSFEYDVSREDTLGEAVGRDCNLRSFGVGAVCWDDDGDDFYLRDFAADGRSIGIEWKTDYGRHGICRMKAGKTNEQHICNKDMIENTFLKYRAGTCNQTATVDCRTPDDYKWTGPASLGWTDWILNDEG